MLDPQKTLEREAKRLDFGDWNTIDTMLREVLLTLKEEQACLKLWFKDKSINEDVRRGIEISLTNISKALEKLAALETGKLSSPNTKSGKSVRLSES